MTSGMDYVQHYSTNRIGAVGANATTTNALNVANGVIGIGATKRNPNAWIVSTIWTTHEH